MKKMKTAKMLSLLMVLLLVLQLVPLGTALAADGADAVLSEETNALKTEPADGDGLDREEAIDAEPEIFDEEGAMGLGARVQLFSGTNQIDWLRFRRPTPLPPSASAAT